MRAPSEITPTRTEVVAALTELREDERRLGVARLATIALACEAWSMLDDSPFDSQTRTEPAVLFGERMVAIGGEGTPEVAEFATLEIGPALGISPDSAYGLVSDVLNLKHRLPILWEKALSGAVREWVARRVARNTASLPLDVARTVDTHLSPLLDGMTDAKILTEFDRLAVLFDTDREQRREEALSHRYAHVYAGTDGTAHIDARLDAAAAVALDQTLDHGARVLAEGGVEGTRNNLRAQALELLAHPSRAHLILDQGLPFDTTPSGQHIPLTLDPDTGEITPTTQEGTGTAGRTAAGTSCSHGVELVVRISDHDLRHRGGGTLNHLAPLTRRALDELLTSAPQVTVRPVIDLTQPVTISQYKPTPELRWIITERDQRELYPYSNRTARSPHIDLDHTIPWHQGGQTTTDNLAALTRKTHRAITHAGFHIEQTTPGTLKLTTPTGQQLWTNAHGTFTQPPPDRTRTNDPDQTTTVILTTALAIITRHRDRITTQAREAQRQERLEAARDEVGRATLQADPGAVLTGRLDPRLPVVGSDTPPPF